MHDLLKQLTDWYARSLESGGYVLVAFLMFLESTFIPLPSELIIPPAAHLAHTQGRMSLAGIVIAGTIGSWLGATAMYWVSRWAGRPLVLRYGKFFLAAPQKVEKAERWAEAYGNYGIFASRLLPVVRHLIGIPAGIVRMDYWRFSLWTLVGSGLWCGVLCWLGIKAGQDEALMRGELRSVTVWAVGVLGMLGAMYWFLVHRQMQKSDR